MACFSANSVGDREAWMQEPSTLRAQVASDSRSDYTTVIEGQDEFSFYTWPSRGAVYGYAGIPRWSTADRVGHFAARRSLPTIPSLQVWYIMLKIATSQYISYSLMWDFLPNSLEDKEIIFLWRR